VLHAHVSSCSVAVKSCIKQEAVMNFLHEIETMKQLRTGVVCTNIVHFFGITLTVGESCVCVCVCVCVCMLENSCVLTARFQRGQPVMVLELCAACLQTCLREKPTLQVQTRSMMAQDIAGKTVEKTFLLEESEK
jgi:hypothetical protein